MHTDALYVMTPNFWGFCEIRSDRQREGEERLRKIKNKGEIQIGLTRTIPPFSLATK